jgi:UDP-N-acetylmuramoyl-tripeptide--D-alanyl-D-alanine ligase
MTTARFTSDELAAATGGRWIGSPPASLEGVSTDTRTLTPGSLFVALRGERFDAHDYLAEAAAKGAAAAVVSERWLNETVHPEPLDSGPSALRSGQAESKGAQAGPASMPALVVADTLVALGAIAHHHRRRFGIPFVGVTGSNGKTTTREMIAAILAARGKVLKTEGNLNNEVGVPLTLLGLDETHASAVIEMGMNHPGEIARLAAIAAPQVGVVTLAAPAHLEGLGTVEAVADAKAELYQGLPAGGIAIANADDARMLRRAQASGRRMLTFAAGRGRRGDVVVLEITGQGEDGLRFVLGVGNREVNVHIPALVGAHNAMNAAAAAAAAIALGATDREIAEGLAQVRPVGRRLRLDRLASGLQLVDDCYNANPASMSAALRTVVELAAGAGGRPAAVLGDMLELGAFEQEAHRALGAEAARAGVRLLAAFGPRSRATAEAARAAGLPEVFHTEALDALVAWARAEVQPSDVLLVKGSRGMKLERLVEALR